MQANRFFSFLFIAVLSISRCQAADIIEAPKTQAQIDKVAVQLGSGVRERARQGLAELQTLQEAYTNQAFFMQQVMYYMRFGAVDERRGNGLIVILNKLVADKGTRVDVAIPVLDSPDADYRHMAAIILNTVDSRDDKGVDFQIYEGLLRDVSSEKHSSLIRYMFDRNPEAAAMSMSRVYGSKADEGQLAAKLQGDPKAVLASLATSSEWWDRLYVAEMMKKDPLLRDRALIENLAQDSHPLVRENIGELNVK